MYVSCYFVFPHFRRPPLCHHPATIPHACHFGECPPCRLQCLKKLSPCSHPCPMMCHSAVKVKIKENVSLGFEKNTKCKKAIVRDIDEGYH